MADDQRPGALRDRRPRHILGNHADSRQWHERQNSFVRPKRTIEADSSAVDIG
jgi:hypothetical protein